MKIQIFKAKQAQLLAIILLTLGFNDTAKSAPQSNAIALILNYPDQEYTQLVVDFYQKTRETIQSKRRWPILESKYLRSLLLERRHGSSTLPTLHIAELESNLEPTQHLLPQVQKLVDTLAIKGAIITHCQMPSEDQTDGCALYYYDRKSARITAAAKKHFAVPLQDVSHWPPLLIKTLASGLDARRKLYEEAKLNEFMKAAHRQTKAYEFGVNMQFAGEQLSVKGSAIKGVPIVSLQPSFYQDGLGFGLQLSYGKSSSTDPNRREQVRYQSVSVVAETSSPALESLLWNLSLLTGYGQQTLHASDESALSQTSIFLTLRPGFLWELPDRWFLGLSTQIKRYFPLTSESQGQYQNRSFATLNMGAGFHVRKVF